MEVVYYRLCVFVIAYVIAGLLVLGLKALREWYFLLSIGVALTANGTYLASINQRRPLGRLGYAGIILTIAGWAILLLSILVLFLSS